MRGRNRPMKRTCAYANIEGGCWKTKRVLDEAATRPKSRIISISFPLQEGICDKNTAPSVSSISRVLRGGRREDDGTRKDHSIDGILGGRSSSIFFALKGVVALYVFFSRTVAASTCSTPYRILSWNFSRRRQEDPRGERKQIGRNEGGVGDVSMESMDFIIVVRMRFHSDVPGWKRARGRGGRGHDE